MAELTDFPCPDLSHCKAAPDGIIFDFRFGGPTNLLLVQQAAAPELWVVDYDRWRDERWTVARTMEIVGTLAHTTGSTPLLLRMPWYDARKVLWALDAVRVPGWDGRLALYLKNDGSS